MRTKFKAWTVDYIKQHPEKMLTMDELLNVSYSYAIEFGSGKGRFILEMAKKFPSINFIGVERNVTCAGMAVKKLVDEDISNAKMMFINADEVLLNLKDNSVDYIFLNFSDPWPKKRHAKRRLTAPKYLSSYARILKNSGLLHIKTDNSDLYNFTLEVLDDAPFEIIKNDENYDGQDDFDAMTEYEESFREENKPIYKLVLKVKENA